MALTESDARDLAKDLLAVRRDECARLDLIRDYIRGKVCEVFVPSKAGREYHQLVKMSLTNIMPLVVSTFAQNLFIEGYRTGRSDTNAKAWSLWQDNRMDGLQSSLFRTVVEYGLGYTMALPAMLDGEKSAEMLLYSPRMLTAVYDNILQDEWPVYAQAVVRGYDKEQRKPIRRLILVDDTYVIRLTAKMDSDEIDEAIEVEEHGLGVTPVVRWQGAGGNLDDQSRGEVEPLMAPQDSLNNTTFGLRSTERAQAYPQRYATGLMTETDENGNEVEPFRGGQDRVWTSDSPDTQFGQFPAASLDGYLSSRQSTLRIITAMAQIAPYALQITDGISNLSAEALAALEAAQQRKIGEYKTVLGEAAEQHLRLASLAAGDEAGWKQRDAEVRWRDTESRSLAQLADALGKMAQMLAIPPQALWDLLPGFTDQQLQNMKKLADKEDGLAQQAMADATPTLPAQDQMPAQMQQMMQQGGGNVVSAGAAGSAGGNQSAGPARAARTPVPAGR